MMAEQATPSKAATSTKKRRVGFEPRPGHVVQAYVFALDPNAGTEQALAAHTCLSLPDGVHLPFHHPHGKGYPVPSHEPPLTPSEVAQMFGVNPGTVNRWAHTGLLRSIRTPGGHHRFPIDQVRQFLTGEDTVGTQGHREEEPGGPQDHVAQCTESQSR